MKPPKKPKSSLTSLRAKEPASSANIAVVFYGPPGSGKGTQAQLLVDKFHLFHLDTGSYLRRLFNDPKFKNDKAIQKERKLNEAGKLNTPAWVLKVVTKQVGEVAKLGQSVVFSGSPRNVYEAFGDREHMGLLDVLVKKYGRANVHIFFLDIPDGVTIKRNTHRTICSVCKTPLLDTKHKSTTCPFCGGKVEHRVDDATDIIKQRLIEYHKRTEPVIAESKKRGYNVVKLDGTPAPYKIHEAIVKYFK
jgi:adenylate kinase